MDCQEARLLVDERVHGTLGPAQAGALDEHLKTCTACAEDLRQLLKMRELVAVARSSRPPEGALSAIWTRVQSAAPAQEEPRMTAAALSLQPVRLPFGFPRSLWGRPVFRGVALSGGIAALLFAAFLLGGGNEEFGTFGARAAAKAPPRGIGPGAVTLETKFESNEDVDAEVRDKLAAREPEAERTDHRVDAGYRNATGGGGGGGGGRSGTLTPAPPNEGITVYWTQPPPTSGSTTFTDGTTVTHGSLVKKSGAFSWDQTKSLQNARESKPADHSEKLNLGDFTYEAAPKLPPAAPPQPGTAPAVKKAISAGEGWGETTGKPPTGPEPTSAPPQVTNPKIIKTGELTLEVKNSLEAARAADALVIKFQAYIADSRTTSLPGGAKRSEIVIRVVPEKFEELFAAFKTLGTVLHERAGGQDITAQYVDTEARIKNLQVAEIRLQELIQSKTYLDKIQSLLEVERELARVRGEIESMTGQMRVWQNQLALSTLRVTLQEPDYAAPGGSLSVEVPSLTEAKKALDAALTAAAAQLLSGQTTKRPDGTLQGTYSLRARFGRFADVVAAIKALGRTQEERIQNQPFNNQVPPGAADVPCDLALVLFERSVPLPTGRIAVEVGTLDAAKKSFDAVLAQNDAQLVNGQNTKRDDGTLMGEFKLRVKLGRFAALLTALKTLGRVQDEQVQRQPFAAALPEGVSDVPCDLDVALFERPVQLPSGNLALEVPSLPAALEALPALLTANQAALVDNQSQRQPDGTVSANLTLRVRAGSFTGLLNALPALGRVLSKAASGESGAIQGGASEALCRLSLVLAEQRRQVPAGRIVVQVEKFPAGRDALSALVQQKGAQVLAADSRQASDGTWSGVFRLAVKAAQMDELVSGIEKVGKVQVRELQGLGLGDLSRVDPNVTGELTVTLAEKPALSPEEGGSFRLLLRDTFGGFLNSLKHIVRGLALLVPWAVLIVLLGWPIWRWARKGARVQPAALPAKPPAPQAAANKKV